MGGGIYAGGPLDIDLIRRAGSSRIDEGMGSIKMTDDVNEKQPEPQNQTTAPAPKENIAAGEAPTATLVAPHSSLVGPSLPPPKPPVEQYQPVWEEAGDGLVFTEADLAGAAVHNDNRAYRRTNALPPGAWVTGPGSVSALVEAIKLLQGASRAAGTNIKEIKWLFAMALPMRSVVLVKAVKEGTPGAVKARREKKGPLQFTISDILREADMEVTTGYKEFFSVKKVSESPIGPCIAINMAKPLRSKRVGEKDEEEEKK